MYFLSNKIIILAIITLSFYACGDNQARAEHATFYQIEGKITLPSYHAKVLELATMEVIKKRKAVDISLAKLKQKYQMMFYLHPAKDSIECKDFDQYEYVHQVYQFPKGATDFSELEILCYYKTRNSKTE